MKLTSLEKLRRSLVEEQSVVTVPNKIAKKARESLENMFALTE
jgi:quinolinate synthase